MRTRKWLMGWLLGALALPLQAQTNAPVEPNAGQWRTWVISSGRDYRVPPPPGAAETQAELRYLLALMADNDDTVRGRITHWDAGAPPYRWIELVTSRLLAGQSVGQSPPRVQAYLAIAMYDATIAAWESKYAYHRQRPTDVSTRVRSELPVPQSPGYPSEHAAVAMAAATVLGHFMPAEADAFRRMAEEAGWSRVLAGLQFPSDFLAGLELGRKVADEVIAKARADNGTAPWTGTVPVDPPCTWTGTNPGNAAAANWKPLLLASPAEFRPPPPPSCESSEVIAQKEAVRTFPRTFATNWKAYYWQSPEGLGPWAGRYMDQWLFEDGLDRNPPRAARAYALRNALFLDTFIASQDGKFTHWYIRPHQLDPAITPLFPVPNFPSYPSNHSTFSAAQGELLAYLFPTRADFVRALAKEAGDSRIWAGLHYQMDNVAGQELGRAVAAKFIEWAKKDGSQ